MKWRHTKEASKDEPASKRSEKVLYNQAVDEANKLTESDYESVIDVQTIDSDWNGSNFSIP